MKYQFCPKCGTQFEPQKNISRLVCQECAFVFYQNSKPTASGIVEKDGKILLGRRTIEPNKGDWDIPGGFLNYGEDPRDAVIRELKEETGLEVEPGEIITIVMDTYSTTNDSTLNIVYRCSITGGELKASDDICDLQWLGPDEVPENFAFENGKTVITQWWENKKAAQS